MSDQKYSADQRASPSTTELASIIRDAQSILAKHLPPDGPSEKDTIAELLGLLDGPRVRDALQFT